MTAWTRSRRRAWQGCASTAVQLWAAMHGLVLLRGNGSQFPWPDLAQTETELISSIAKLRYAPYPLPRTRLTVTFPRLARARNSRLDRRAAPS